MIEFRAREDWTAGRITLWVMILEKPSVGASLSFDLSPEIAERLAQDLQAAVKRYRELDKDVEKALAPKAKKMWEEGCPVQLKMEGSKRGKIQRNVNPNAPQYPVVWENSSLIQWVDVQDLMVSDD